jgi:hypothetical protein
MKARSQRIVVGRVACAVMDYDMMRMQTVRQCVGARVADYRKRYRRATVELI